MSDTQGACADFLKSASSLPTDESDEFKNEPLTDFERGDLKLDIIENHDGLIYALREVRHKYVPTAYHWAMNIAIARIFMSKERMFPLLDGAPIPWLVIAPFDHQAKINHGGQNLERLAERGGLSVKEAIHVLEEVRWQWDARSDIIGNMTQDEASRRLGELVFRQKQKLLSDQLLPCPFCGGVESSVRKTLRDGCKPDEIEAFAYTIVCQSCAAEGGWAKSEAGAKRWWNTRSK